MLVHSKPVETGPEKIDNPLLQQCPYGFELLTHSNKVNTQNIYLINIIVIYFDSVLGLFGTCG